MPWFWEKPNSKKLEIVSTDFDIVNETLIVKFSDGSFAVHQNVKRGYVIGLVIAADKRDFYDTCIRDAFPLTTAAPPAVPTDRN